MFGPTASDPALSHPTSHGKFLFTNSYLECHGELLKLFYRPKNFWNSSKEYTFDVSFTWTWTATSSSPGEWYRSNIKGLACQTLHWLLLPRNSCSSNAIGDLVPPTLMHWWLDTNRLSSRSVCMATLWGTSTNHIPSLQRTIPGSKTCGNTYLILTFTSISMRSSSWNLSEEAIHLWCLSSSALGILVLQTWFPWI